MTRLLPNSLFIVAVLFAGALGVLLVGCSGTAGDRRVAEPGQAAEDTKTRTKALRKALRGVTRVEIHAVERRVVAHPDGTRRTRKEFFAHEDDPKEINRLVEALEIVTPPDIELYCPQSPTPVFRFYRDDRCVVRFALIDSTMHTRWFDGPIPGDGSLSEKSYEVVAQWLADRGIHGPMKAKGLAELHEQLKQAPLPPTEPASRDNQ